MDTIIYVYLKKGYGEKYHRQDFDMRSYRLVRVGVSEKFLQILQERELKEKVAVEKKNCCMLWEKWWRKHRIHNAERIRKQNLIEEARIRLDFVQELLEDRNRSYFVTEEPVPFLEGWSFRGYSEEEWVFHMMQYASGNHFVILGKVDCIPRLLLQYVKKMKSLKWLLSRRQFGETEQELVEEIYEEYGLAVEVHLVEEESDLRRWGPVCRLPAVIIDFCSEERIYAADVAKDSIWLDMRASELKRRRIEERNTGISYFSLKKEWKQPQKALYYLDTINKNGYNT